VLHDRDCKIIVEAIIDLARKLGLESVAEGVESDEIWLALRGLECDRGQGYYLGRPMSADRIASTLRTHDLKWIDRFE
jgi:EAL domain-containing protein (putative c-di-GMP-specific phosphodiesterase class I)